MQLTRLQRLAAQAIVSVFETGRPAEGYGQVTLLKGDPGGLTYGRFQTTRGSGSLYFLVKDYVDRPGAAQARALSKYLPRLLQRDPALDQDAGLRRLLKSAGDDPVMRQAQDDFFDRNYWAPAAAAARELGVGTALGLAVIYDSKVHGSFERIRDRTVREVGRPPAIGEEAWISAYVAERRDWLAGHSRPVLRKTVYRMAAFERLIRARNWDLDLPFKVMGVRIDAAALGGGRTGSTRAPRSPRILALAEPAMKGDDVRDVQARLRELGYGIEADGVYGPATAGAVRKFQAAQGLKADGYVGPITLARLNAPRPLARAQTLAAVAEPPAEAPAPAAVEPPSPAPAAPKTASEEPAAGARPGRAKHVRKGAAGVAASLLGNLAGPWLVRWSMAPVAAIGAASAAVSELGDTITLDVLEKISPNELAALVRPTYEWLVATFPDEATRMLAIGALLWVLVATLLRRSPTRRAQTRAGPAVAGEPR